MALKTKGSIGVILMKAEIAASYRLIKNSNFKNPRRIVLRHEPGFHIKKSLSIYIIPGGR